MVFNVDSLFILNMLRKAAVINMRYLNHYLRTVLNGELFQAPTQTLLKDLFFCFTYRRNDLSAVSHVSGAKI